MTSLEALGKIEKRLEKICFENCGHGANENCICANNYERPLEILENNLLNSEEKKMKYKPHTLKIQPKYFRDILYFHKSFEIRKDDRDYKVGNYIHFVNTNGEEFELYEHNLYRITYILRDVEEYGLNKDYCILAIRSVKEFDL